MITMGLMALAPMAAHAATLSSTTEGTCVATPAYWSTTQLTAVTHDEQRWLRNIPATTQTSPELTKFEYTIAGNVEVSHYQWKYSRFVPGQAEQSYWEYEYSRQNPGQAEQSHQVYKYSRQNTEYRFRTRAERPDNTVEHKYVLGYDFVSGGTTTVSGHTVAGHWVQSAGWHAIPDVIVNVVWGTGGVPTSLLGGSEANPKGSVNVNVYGGPNRNVSYYASLVTIEGGYTDWGPWSDFTPNNPGGNTATRDIDIEVTTELYNNGNWTTDVNPQGWTKVGEDTVVDQAAIAPYTEYRAQDGSATTDLNNIGWFKETAVDGWERYGDPKKVTTAVATEDKTLYLTRDDQGNLGESTSEADVATFLTTTGVDLTLWTEYGREKVTTQEATPDTVIYLTIDDQGALGYTVDLNKASWFELGKAPGGSTPTWQETNEDPNTPFPELAYDLSSWGQVNNEDGTPLVYVITTAIPGYRTFYVHDTQATRELGESNWTIDRPTDWILVDKRTIVDKAASETTTLVPATYTTCPTPAAAQLAATGSNNPLIPGGVAVGLLLLGTGAVLISRLTRGAGTSSANTLNS